MADDDVLRVEAPEGVVVTERVEGATEVLGLVERVDEPVLGL